jgi:hypothetical protein
MEENNDFIRGLVKPRRGRSVQPFRNDTAGGGEGKLVLEILTKFVFGGE